MSPKLAAVAAIQDISSRTATKSPVASKTNSKAVTESTDMQSSNPTQTTASPSLVQAALQDDDDDEVVDHKANTKKKAPVEDNLK